MMSFYFSIVDKSTVMKVINNLKPKKAAQDINIPVKILQLDCEFLTGYIYSQFNATVSFSNLLALFNPNLGWIFRASFCAGGGDEVEGGG